MARHLEAAVRLVRDGVVAAQSGEFGGGEWLLPRVRRVLLSTSSRGDRERLVAHMALIAAAMARRVPDAEREQVFDELISVARLGPADQAMLKELAKFGMVS